MDAIQVRRVVDGGVVSGCGDIMFGRMCSAHRI